MADPPRLNEMMQTIADSLSEPGDIEQALARITRIAIGVAPAADYASISIRHYNGRLETVAPTDASVKHLDTLQYQLNEGPCYDALTAEEIVYARDLGQDDRWPSFGPQAAELGVLSQLAVGLAHRGGSLSALNLYSHDLYAFESHDAVVSLFTSQAAMVQRYALKVQKLNQALSSGTLVGRATGIVMQRHCIGADDALTRLKRLAMSNHADLENIADRVVKRARYEDDAEGPTPL